MQMYISHEVTFTSLMEAVCGRKKGLEDEKIFPLPPKLTSLRLPLFCHRNIEMQIFLDIISNLEITEKDVKKRLKSTNSLHQYA